MHRYIYKNEKWVSQEENHPAPPDVIQWFDFIYEETDWHKTVARLADIKIHENHIQDTFHVHHSPKCEVGQDYDFLIMQTVKDMMSTPMDVASCSFILTESTLISIHPTEISLEAILLKVQQRRGNHRLKTIGNIPSLLHRLLNGIIENQMSVRPVFMTLFEEWQEDLISKKMKPEAWGEYFNLQKSLHLFISNLEMQIEALAEWEKETDIKVNEYQQVSFSDLNDQLERLNHHLKSLRKDTDNLLQIYFSITQEKNNRIVQLLTIISVIFLPLNLMAGLFGMNFQELPFKDVTSGFWWVISFMVTMGLLLYVLLSHVLKIR